MIKHTDKTKILMVYPEFPATYWSYEHVLPFTGKKSLLPPLGLMTVAALLPDNYDVSLIDLNVDSRGLEEAIHAADLVFVSALLVQKESFNEIVRLCGDSGTPIAAGGPYAISSHEHIEGVSHFILDEAEVTLPAFLADYEAGTAKPLYSSGGEKPELSRTPIPRFDIVDVQAYQMMSLQYSRGCPFNCEFCDIIEMFGRKVRVKSTEQFISELDAVYAAGFTGNLFIVDDNFIGNKKEVKTLLPKLAAWQKARNYPFQLSTEASINLAHDDELLKMMAASGFSMVFVGIETPDQDTLEHTQKCQNLKGNTIDDVKKIQAAGIEVTGGFIVGFDTDKEDIFDRQLDFIQEAGIPVAMVGMLTALPNTQLYRRLKSENRLTEESSGDNTHRLNLNFLPKMSLETVVEGYKNLLEKIFSPKLYFKRCMTLLKKKPLEKDRRKKVSKADLKAFFSSLYKQTFSRYGLRYLSFLARSLFHTKISFPEAVALAVKGHHFFIITRKILKEAKLLPPAAAVS
ncbi:MAG: B12-binding domain-containing radical SAM protein [Spirochaetia bacterium]